MSKVKVLTVLLVVCLAVLAAGAWFAFGRASGFNYENAEAYTAGGIALDGPVENLDVHWEDGSVNIEYHAENTVVLSETAAREISADRQLRWWLDGATLHVQYAKSGFRLNWNLNKALTITLPKGAALKNINIQTASGDVNAPEVRAETLKVGTASGDVALTQTGGAKSVAIGTASGGVTAETQSAEKVSVESASGDIALTQTGSTDALTLESTSGRIAARVESVAECRVDSTSGAIEYAAAGTARAAISSTSGKIRFVAEEFEALSIDTTSGDVTASLPARPGFTADIDTTSGNFDSGIPMEKSGDTWRCGDGSGKVSIHTTSGDIRLE